MGAEKGENTTQVSGRSESLEEKSLIDVVYRTCGAKNGQWCAYPRAYTANGRAVAVDPSEARFGIRMQC